MTSIPNPDWKTWDINEVAIIPISGQGNPIEFTILDLLPLKKKFVMELGIGPQLWHTLIVDFLTNNYKMSSQAADELYYADEEFGEGGDDSMLVEDWLHEEFYPIAVQLVKNGYDPSAFGSLLPSEEEQNEQKISQYDFYRY